ncbi:MAG: hypothetical protein ACRD0Z_08660 [Acidimicrobiales bacterium]
MGLGESHEENLSAAFGARRDLGNEYDREIAAGVVEQMSRDIDARVDERVIEILASAKVKAKRGGTTLAVYSMILGIPLSAIAGNEAHLGGLVVAWSGIVAINAANAWRRSSSPIKLRR